jgi:prepilin-type processing-associated H-X9-DG protein
MRWDPPTANGRSAPPSRYPIFADSIGHTGVPSKYQLKQYYLFYLHASSMGRMHLRHARRANIAFLDLHVGNFNESDVRGFTIPGIFVPTACYYYIENVPFGS